MIVFGCEVESFREKLVLSGECTDVVIVWKVFLLDYRNFLQGILKHCTMNMKYERGFGEQKGLLTIYF